MALIDVLPKFAYKPLTFDERPASQLVPRPTEETPAEAPVQAPVAPVTPATPAQTKPVYLPDAYKQYEPLMAALNESSITSPEARSAVLAQMGLERGWKAPADFNYGNITTGSSWKGASNQRGDSDAAGKPIQQQFRSYGSAKEFVDDYLGLLKRQYPKAYSQLSSDKFDVDAFTEGLVGGQYKYATDPTYKSKVKGVYNSVLQKFSETNK